MEEQLRNLRNKLARCGIYCGQCQAFHGTAAAAAENMLEIIKQD